MKTILAEAEIKVKEKFISISPCLNERSRRIWAATEAKSIGWGGIAVVSRATGMDHKTIQKGITELNIQDRLDSDCVRKEGGGRKKLTVSCPDVIKDLESLVEPVTSGDPESPLRWTSKSTYKLADELKNKGHQIGQRSVCELLKTLGYSLQANKKVKEGNSHQDRNAQFEYINEKIKRFQESNQPVISVDTKKKENIGNFKNNGREYHKKGKPCEVNVYDFKDKNLGKVAPYGVYDITQNKGWVNVGITNDTAEFAVESIRIWWQEMGSIKYQGTKEILITADCGGSNGYKVRLWKLELQKLANELKMTINISHFPPGTSKWNKIEHKMFSFISQNWRGKPLVDRATVVNLIGNTRTNKGLEIRARLDENLYKKGIKVTDKEFQTIKLEMCDFHGEWNYKIHPNNNE